MNLFEVLNPNNSVVFINIQNEKQKIKPKSKVNIYEKPEFKTYLKNLHLEVKVLKENINIVNIGNEFLIVPENGAGEPVKLKSLIVADIEEVAKVQKVKEDKKEKSTPIVKESKEETPKEEVKDKEVKKETKTEPSKEIEESKEVKEKQTETKPKRRGRRPKNS